MMDVPRQNDGERRLNSAVSLCLLVGVAVSGSLLGLGLVPSVLFNLPRAAGLPPPMAEVYRGILVASPVSMLYLGLIVLMATPVVRVAVLAAGWAAQARWRAAGVAMFVLILLGMSVGMGVG